MGNTDYANIAIAGVVVFLAYKAFSGFGDLFGTKETTYDQADLKKFLDVQGAQYQSEIDKLTAANKKLINDNLAENQSIFDSAFKAGKTTGFQEGQMFQYNISSKNMSLSPNAIISPFSGKPFVPNYFTSATGYINNPSTNVSKITPTPTQNIQKVTSSSGHSNVVVPPKTTAAPTVNMSYNTNQYRPTISPFTNKPILVRR